MRFWLTFFSLLLFCHPVVFAKRFIMKSNSDLIGALSSYQVKPGDRFIDIAKHFDVGYDELHVANPKIIPESLVPGTVLLIPSLYLLPKAQWRQAIVINLSSRRLFYFPKDDSRHVYTYPVGIGRRGWLMPEGLERVLFKRRNPTWHVPKSVKQAYDQDGINLPSTIKPGPNNPLGTYAIHLSLPGYLIHGTNVPSRVGRRSSSGCLSMFAQDIKSLYHLVDKHTAVRVTNTALKLGKDESGHLWLDVMAFVSDRKIKPSELKSKAFDIAHRDVLDRQLRRELSRHKGLVLDWSLLSESLVHMTGVPVVIGLVQP